MQAMICDACRRPMEHEGVSLSLLPAKVISSPGGVPHLTDHSGNTRVLWATLCLRCGERLSAIIRHKLKEPCPTCEVAPMAEGDERAEQRLRENRRAI